MAGIQIVDGEQAASALADRLNGNARRRPVVVVTSPAGSTEPWIDAEEIAREAGSLAEVYLMPTGPATWEFARRMADGTQVYGGAGRVYPVGHEWASDLTKSPLRFAFDVAEGRRASQHLISDMLRMAAASGLLQNAPTSQLREVRGSVMMVVAGRALVDIGNGFPAAIAEELTVEDVPIGRIVAPSLRVRGSYDPQTNRLDVRGQIREGSDALRRYEVGDVVLARVAKVRSGRAELVLYPKTSTPAVSVTVLRAHVSDNPNEDLTTLMTPGEVIRARLTGTAPKWELRIDDVDDDEPVSSPPSLVEGGPPWLVEVEEHPVETEPDRLATPVPPTGHTVIPELEVPLEPPEVARPRPSPMLLDRNRTAEGRLATDPSGTSESTRSLLLKIDGLNAEVTALRLRVERSENQLLAAADERGQLRYLLAQAERHGNRVEHDLRVTRARLRKLSGRTAAASTSDPRFADREQGFRYLVLTRWATRTPPADQSDWPLGDYALGPRFLDSLEKLEGIKVEKVADVVFEVVTGLAQQIPGRELHHLRTGMGGDDPVRTREDGAVAWRASLQVNSPSARRLHYWVLPDGMVELARVTMHDDYGI